jgi:hypothetical protein
MARSIVSLSAIRQRQWKALQEKLSLEREKKLYRNHPFKINEECLVRNHQRKKFEARWLGPFLIVGLHSKGVVVRRENGQKIPYNFAHIKRFLATSLLEVVAQESGGENDTTATKTPTTPHGFDATAVQE